MSQLKPAAQRVQDVRRAKGLDADVRHMPASTRTAQDAADACGVRSARSSNPWCSAAPGRGSRYLLLVSGANRVDETMASQPSIGEALSRPDAQYVRDVTGFAIGGIPPLGHATPIATFMDEALLAYDVVWAAAERPMPCSRSRRRTSR